MDTAGERRRERKKRLYNNFNGVLDQFKNVLLVTVDNVGSGQMQKVRKALRGKAVMVMGKKTLLRMVIRKALERNPKLESILPHLRGNTGLVFTNEDLATIRSVVVEFKVPAAAKAGTFAPNDVIVPPGATGLDPGQTAFFQALNIATKIAKGSIEITSEVLLIKKGEKITSSQTALLGKLDIKPFFYGLVPKMCYDNGSVYPPDVLDLKEEDLMKKFFDGVSKLTALSLGANWPNQLTVPIYVASAFRKLAALALATNYPLAQLEELSKAAAAAAAAPAPAAAAPAAKEVKKVEAKKEEEKPEEEEEAGVGGLFGD
jgi:large subunit ribosomal protein LP0